MFYYISLGIGVAVSLSFVFVRTSGNNVRNLIFKSISSLFYLLTAVFAVIENSNAQHYGSLIIMGGALGLVGDILLDLKGVYKKDANEYLKGGFSFFLVGHIFYVGALIYYNKIGWLPILISLLVSVAISAGNILSANVMKIHFGRYRRIVFIYVVFLCLTACLAVYAAFATHSKSMILAAIGAVSFLLSDIVLSETYFGRGFDGKVWLFINHFLYYAGQYLIAASVFFIN
ncbi:MAG: lysoplasmalogenase [Clostridiales bacterium]|nr:lysoplasmalogenase [Clostridiales bacterium]